MEFKKPRCLLTKLELAIEVGYVIFPYMLECAYKKYQYEKAMNRDYKNKESCKNAPDHWRDLVRNPEYKDSFERINSRMRGIIQKIMDQEELRCEIEETDKLQPKKFETPIKIDMCGNFPKEEYKPEDKGYDRNQFIRSFFRYKGYKVVDIKENETIEICKKNLPKIMSSKLYSFEEISQKFFSSCIIRNIRTNEILKIDFPLTTSAIEKIVRKYEIKPIMFWLSKIEYLFESDLKYLSNVVPCLKFRDFKFYRNISYDIPDDYEFFPKKSWEEQKLVDIKFMQEHKLTSQKSLRKVITFRTNPVIKSDGEVLNRTLEYSSIYNNSKAVEDTNSLSINEKADFILEFFEKLPKSYEVCVMYESDNDVLSQMGYAEYDTEKKEIIINNCAIKIDQLISIQRIVDSKSRE